MEHRLNEPIIWNVLSLVICGSILAHGITGALLTKLYGLKSGTRVKQGSA